jgi:hypothetical protein
MFVPSSSSNEILKQEQASLIDWQFLNRIGRKVDHGSRSSHQQVP